MAASYQPQGNGPYDTYPTGGFDQAQNKGPIASAYPVAKQPVQHPYPAQGPAYPLPNQRTNMQIPGDMANQLPPSSRPLAVLPAYIAQHSETIVMKEKVMSLSDDAFFVKTLDGREILKISADTFSLSHRKHVCDVADNPLFTIRHEVLSIPASYYAESPSGQKIFEVVGKFHLGTSRAEGRFTNAMSGQPEKLLMAGSFFNKTATITNEANGEVVAKIDRDFFNANQLLFERQTYAVTVAPGVDMSLIVAMVVCLDERRDARENRRGI